MFSEETHRQHQSLKRFLMKNLYKHEKVRQMTDEARSMVEHLFRSYFGRPIEMAEEFTALALGGDDLRRARTVADYIAGMTDRYAIAEYRRLA